MRDVMVYLLDDHQGEDLYVAREGVAELTVLSGDTVSTRYTLPSAAVELQDPDEMRSELLAEVRTALADVPMSKAARAAVEKSLDKLEGE